MPQIQRDGAVLNYEICGESGPWVTLINGHTRPLNDFRMMSKYLAARGLRCLLLDNRGSGLTVCSENFKLADMVNDVKGLWDHLEILKSSVLGISMGGFLAQQIAVDYEQNIDRLILVSTANSKSTVANIDEPWGDTLDQIEKRMSKYFTPEFALSNQPIIKGMTKQILNSVKEGAFIKNAELQSHAVRDFDATGKLSSFAGPTCIIHGDKDRIVAVEAAENLKKEIDNSFLEVIKGAGHLLWAEEPKKLYLIAADFLLADGR